MPQCYERCLIRASRVVRKRDCRTLIKSARGLRAQVSTLTVEADGSAYRKDTQRKAHRATWRVAATILPLGLSWLPLSSQSAISAVTNPRLAARLIAAV